jgi:hypothetical protein
VRKETFKARIILLMSLGLLFIASTSFPIPFIADQQSNEITAVLSTISNRDMYAGNLIEMIGLTSKSLVYVFAIDFDSVSSTFIYPNNRSIVLWGYSGIPPREDSRRHRNEELLNTLMMLKPLNLKENYPPLENAGSIGWFNIKVNNNGKLTQKTITADSYYQFDTQNPFYPVFDYMRSLKKDVTFLPQGYNLVACANELEEPEPILKISPHWEALRLTMIEYLAQNNYQDSRPLFERLLKKETDKKIIERLKDAIQRLQK